MLATTTEQLQSVHAKMMDLYFEEGWTKPRLAARYGYSETAVRKMVRAAEALGRARLKKATHDPRRRENRRPLSAFHARLGLMVSRYMAREQLNCSKFGVLVGFTRLRVGEMQSGYYDLTLTQLERVCSVLDTTWADVLRSMNQGGAVGV